VQGQPNANTVKVVDSVKRLLPQFRSQLPESIRLTVLNDRSVSIRDAVHDVNITLGVTVLLVILVIYLFLHRLTATMIPAVTMPISLIGAMSLLYWLGYSIDNVSLLGITLAVGLVVDDAIVVLENIVRHIEDGMPPMQASLQAAREHVRSGVPRRARALHAHARLDAGAPPVDPRGRPWHLHPHGPARCDDAQRFLPRGRHQPDPGDDGSVGRHLFPGHAGIAGP